MIARLITAYVLYRAWKDRKNPPPRRNPYSMADLLRRNYLVAQSAPNAYMSSGQMYGILSNPTLWR